MRDASVGPLDNDVTPNDYVWLALANRATLLVASVYLAGLGTVLGLRTPPGRR